MKGEQHYYLNTKKQIGNRNIRIMWDLRYFYEYPNTFLWGSEHFTGNA